MFIVGKSFFSETFSKLDITSRGYLTTPFKSPLSLAHYSDYIGSNNIFSKTFIKFEEKFIYAFYFSKEGHP